MVDFQVLRNWELRYQWPCPARHANGYRTYSATLIEELRWVADRLSDGNAIGSLIREGRLVRDDPPHPKKPPKGAGIDFSSLAPPTTTEGRSLRKRLEGAIRAGDDGQNCVGPIDGGKTAASGT